jgi:hypothetical protein
MSENARGGARQRASNGSVPRGEKAQRFNDAQFDRHELTEAEKKQLKAIMAGDDWTFLSELQRALEHPVKVTLNWDTYGDCWGCWITSPTKPGSPNVILTGRGRTVEKAFAEAWYKLWYTYDGVFPEAAAHRSKQKSWDEEE